MLLFGAKVTCGICGVFNYQNFGGEILTNIILLEKRLLVTWKLSHT